MTLLIRSANIGRIASGLRGFRCSSERIPALAARPSLDLEPKTELFHERSLQSASPLPQVRCAGSSFSFSKRLTRRALSTPEQNYPTRAVVCELPVPLSVDAAASQCDGRAAEVQRALLELELAGRIERHPGNRVALVAG
jgi:predicted Rossmann fold nucleotide-binding protein DprA/Smf involved in DNA uptake